MKMTTITTLIAASRKPTSSDQLIEQSNDQEDQSDDCHRFRQKL